MTALGETPNTPEKQLRRAIALILDAGLIYEGGGSFSVEVSLDDIVEKIALAAERILDTP
jgi:hypothetical protein